MPHMSGQSLLFTSLPPRLQERIKKIQGWENLVYRVGRQGNFTVVFIIDKATLNIYYGIAKRDPNSDKPDAIRGLIIAGSRAVHGMLLNKEEHGKGAN